MQGKNLKVKKVSNHTITDQKNIKIIGIGNTLYSDEGVGVHLLPYLEEALSGYDNVEIIEGATDGMKLLEPVEEADYLIIIDAINAGKPGGELITIRNREIPKYYGVKMSIHQVGFQEVLFAADLQERLPEEMVMFGIQPASLELGVELSAIVKEKLPELAENVVEQIKQWSGKN
ncbi:HyaD/HybD family hydrogenase maturation endopeptidase [Thermoactinomyces mirandus]|uniref:HyaD/HybD family hydrogenase maturation endopeptidase n=1 Tax=Thermoactinomyces mirandus TaxID=2756294 RepID=A0A7W1XR91_9BACL|nr:HyaD/HybD family hydrogenase maturation endopeptidase [Thermoactinomyces mirandus]